MTADAPSIGDSSYEALQVMAQKRFKSGSSMTVAYTRSTMQGTADVLAPWLEANRNGIGGGLGVQDNTNINGNTTNPGEQSFSSFQTPNRLVVNYVYDLPFGRGQRFASNATGLLNGLIGSWAINGISTFQDGFPLALQNNALNTVGNYPYTRGFSGPGETSAGITRPNYAVGCYKHSGVAAKPSDRLSKWFNTSCFSVPGPWEFGNEPRVDSGIRSQGIDSTDFSMSKSLPFHDRYRADFRAEVFNIANWTQFSPPSEQADSTSFGKVTAQYNQPRLIQMSGRFTFQPLRCIVHCLPWAGR